MCGNNYLKCVSRLGNGLLILDTKIIRLQLCLITLLIICTNKSNFLGVAITMEMVTKAYKLHDSKQLVCAEDKKYGSVK